MSKGRNDEQTKSEQRKNRRENRHRDSGNADWGTCNSAKLVNAIQQVTKHGYAIRLGYTREGSAFAIGIVGDGEPFTEYVRPSEDIDLYLDGLAEDYA